jgi:murein DD-endopeptidase MepM/ murein hydrolase activator NlpD
VLPGLLQKKGPSRPCRWVWWVGGLVLTLSSPALAQISAPDPITLPTEPVEPTRLCPAPALDRVQRHTVRSGETLGAIAASYNLLPATLMGMNSAVVNGRVVPGQTLRIPPFNGIEVTVSGGSTWADVAATYQVRADVLFEINGCVATPPRRIFVPGVNWLPGVEQGTVPASTATHPLRQYPLADVAPIVISFGWQPHPTEDRLIFNSGVTLATVPGADILAAGPGTVAYVGPHETLGTLVVVNHAQGMQTRYGQVTGVTVAVGDTVTAGTAIAQMPADIAPETPAYFYFEVRTNSPLGWVARNPGDYLPELAVQ